MSRPVVGRKQRQETDAAEQLSFGISFPCKRTGSWKRCQRNRRYRSQLYVSCLAL